ncbi:hypothetical protein ACFWSF_05055 [Streptomyces sp. NPDC058611]|uniref:hypothetical protein n=1 Tax=unclassified Streptomyces TaxID=2593676 RepID=UPI00365E5C41
MRSRRLVISAAFVAAGVGLVPVTAHAADPVATKASAVAKAAASDAHTYTSPADRSVRKGLSTAQPKTTGNPDLKVALEGQGYSAHNVMLETKIQSVDTALDVTIAWGDGTSDKVSAKGAEPLYRDHAYAEVGSYVVKVTVKDTANGVEVSNELALVTAGSEFTPYAPTRILDTRFGTGAAQAKVAPSGTVRVKVGGNGGIPAGVSAVVLNVTVTNPTDSGFVTVFPEGRERPATSNVNYEAGQTVPNQVIVPVGKNGYVDLYNGSWGGSSVDLIADVTGYFTPKPASGYKSLEPVRFVDTREGLGAAKGQLAGQKGFSTQISGLRGVPAGVKAVALNVTVTDPKGLGHLTVFPGGGTLPNASNLNFTAGQTIANSVIVPVGSDGRISVFNGAWAPTDVVVDVVGFYSPANKAAFRPSEPFRTIDTRDPDNRPEGKVPARGYISQLYPEPEGLEASVFNVTVTNTTGSGFLSVAPDPNAWGPPAPAPARPGSSTLNWTAGKTVPNLVQASDGERGGINFWNQGWSDVDLVVDSFGFYETN